MNLYLYNSKHEQILDTFHINEQFNERHILDLLLKITQFLERNNIMNDYCQLVLAEKYVKIIEEDFDDFKKILNDDT